jgi:predicted nucleic acid-binding protein
LSTQPEESLFLSSITSGEIQKGISKLNHDMTVVTRNTRDMEAGGVRLYNAWG